MVVLFWGQNTCVAKGNEKARLVQGLHPENLAWIPRTMVWKRYLLPLSIKYGYSGYRLDFRGVHAGQAPSTWNASACGPLEAQLPQRALQQAFGGAWSWSQVMKTESRTFNLMLGDVVFHKGSLLSKMYGALPGIPQQCPTPNLTIFLSPKQHDLAGIHHCHLVLSRSEQEKMRQYEFEGHSGSWVERCSKSLLGWFQIRRDRQLMICQHVSTALDLLNLLILVFFFWKLEEFETASKESSLGRYPTNVSTLDLAHSWEFRSVADYVESLEEAVRLAARLAAPAPAPVTKWKVPAMARSNTTWSRQWEHSIAGGQSSSKILVDSWVFNLNVVLVRLKWIEIDWTRLDSQIVLDSTPTNCRKSLWTNQSTSAISFPGWFCSVRVGPTVAKWSLQESCLWL